MLANARQHCMLTLFASCFGTDLFMVVERSKDIMHVKLLQSIVSKISNVYKCKREQAIVFMRHNDTGHLHILCAMLPFS